MHSGLCCAVALGCALRNTPPLGHGLTEGFRKQLDVQRLLDAATRWCDASSAAARGQGADGATGGLGAADMRQVALAHADATRRRGRVLPISAGSLDSLESFDSFSSWRRSSSDIAAPAPAAAPGGSEAKRQAPPTPSRAATLRTTPGRRGRERVRWAAAGGVGASADSRVDFRARRGRGAGFRLRLGSGSGAGRRRQRAGGGAQGGGGGAVAGDDPRRADRDGAPDPDRA